MKPNHERCSFSRRARTFGVLPSQFQCQPWQQQKTSLWRVWAGRAENTVLGPGTWTRHAKGDFGTCARLQEPLGEGELDSTQRVAFMSQIVTGKHATWRRWHTRGATSWCKEDPPDTAAQRSAWGSALRKEHRGASVLLSDELLFSSPFSWSTVALPLLMLCLFLL